MGACFGDRLRVMSEASNQPPNKLIKDVETRWCDTSGEQKEALELDKSADGIPPLLTSVDWINLELLEPVLRPFMEAQKELGGAKYVTGSLFGTIYDLCGGLEAAIDNLQLPPLPEDIDQDFWCRHADAICRASKSFKQTSTIAGGWNENPHIQGGCEAPASGVSTGAGVGTGSGPEDKDPP